MLVAAIAVAGTGIILIEYFAPQPTLEVDDTAGYELVKDAPILKAGLFSSADDAHEVSGEVALYQTAQGRVLRFSEYTATSGPDVFFYLSSDAEFSAERATRLELPGGVGEGQATLRGNFSAPVPADAGAFSKVVVWCKRFGVKFGEATLE